MANNMGPDQTAPIGAVCSWSTLFASILNFSVMLLLFTADDFSRRHFQMHFFLGALRVKYKSIKSINQSKVKMKISFNENVRCYTSVFFCCCFFVVVSCFKLLHANI